MNNNQTTAEDTTTETTTVTSPATTTTEAPATDTTTVTTTTETTTTTEALDVTEEAAAGTIDGLYNGATVSGPFVLKETFNALESTLNVDSGDTLTATNVDTAVVLTSNRIINNDATSVFLRATNSQINMTLGDQVIEGDIVLDSLSTLSLSLSNQSYYMGVINGADTAKSVTVNLDATSQLVLAGDSYITTLENADTTNQNIYSNGYKLYVGGTEVAVNGSVAPAVPEVKKETETETQQETVQPTSQSSTVKQATNLVPFIVGSVAVLVIIVAVIVFMMHNKKKNQPTASVAGFPGAPEGTRPDFSAFDDGPVAQPQPPMQPEQPAQPEPSMEPQAPEAPAAPETPEPVKPVEPTNGSPINPFHPNA